MTIHSSGQLLVSRELYLRELKQRRFWATHVNRKWGFLPFYMPWRYQIFIAKFLFSFKDDLPESFNQATAQWCKVHFRLTSVAQKRCCLSSLKRRSTKIRRSARAGTSGILAGKRDSCSHPTTTFSGNVVVVETSYQMLEVLSFCYPGKGLLTSFNKNNRDNFSG